MTEDKSILWARLSVRHTKKTCCVAILIPVATIAILYFTKLFVLTEPSDNEYLVRCARKYFLIHSNISYRLKSILLRRLNMHGLKLEKTILMSHQKLLRLLQKQAARAK